MNSSEFSVISSCATSIFSETNSSICPKELISSPDSAPVSFIESFSISLSFEIGCSLFSWTLVSSKSLSPFVSVSSMINSFVIGEIDSSSSETSSIIVDKLIHHLPWCYRFLSIVHYLGNEQEQNK